MKRVLSLLLVLTMLCSFGTVFAQEEAPAEETPAEEVIETAPEEPAAETAAEPAEEAAEEAPAEETPAEEIPAEEIPAEESAEETPSEEPAAEETPVEETEAEPVADGSVLTGTCDDGLKWSMDTETGTLTISGSGKMASYYDSDPDWDSYKSEVTTLVIESGVRSIGSSAFYSYDRLTSVSLPDTLEYIGAFAFKQCTALTSIVIPDGVTSLGKYAFCGCNHLQSVVIPGSIKNIQTETFCNCSALTDVSIGEGVEYIGKNAFYWCTSLKSVDIPASVTTIYTYATNCFFSFTGCSNLTALNVAEDNPVYFSSDGVLYSKTDKSLLFCPRGKSGELTIADGVTTISELALKDCTKLTSVTVSSGVTSIKYYAFYGCSSLTKVMLPASVTTIVKEAFTECSALTEVCCYEGSDKDSITIGSGNECLTGATWRQIYTVTYDANGGTGAPNSQTVWNGEALKLSLKKPTRTGYTFRGWAESSTGRYSYYPAGGSYTTDKNVTLYAVWDENIYWGSDNNHTVWTLNEITGVMFVSNSTGVIPDFTYEGTDHPGWSYHKDLIRSVEINADVTTVGALAFKDCVNLQKVTMTSAVTSIDAAAFSGCTGLTDVYYDGTEEEARTLKATLESAELLGAEWHYAATVSYDANGGTGAPEAQTKWTGEALTLSSTVPTRTNYVFLGWAGEADAETVQYAAGGSYTAEGGTTLYAVWRLVSGKCGEDLTWTFSTDKVLTVSGTGDMYNYTSVPWMDLLEEITDIVIGEGVTGICSAAFFGCTAAQNVTIPASVETIGAFAFGNCGSLTDVCYGGTEEGWADVTVGDNNDCLTGANWQYGRYMVTYSAGEGSKAPSPQVAAVGETLVIADAASRPRYRFTGWANGTDETAEGYHVYQPGDTYEAGVPATLYAVWEKVTAGTCGEGLTWETENDHTLIIRGTGAMEDYTDITAVPWYEYMDSITEVIIDTGVTSVGSNAFNGCAALTTITLPVTVCIVDDAAFSGCTALVEVFYGGSTAQADLMEIVGIDSTNKLLEDSEWYCTCVITYDASGGTGAPEAQSAYEKSIVTLSAGEPTREGYTFLGWSEAADSTEPDYTACDIFRVLNTEEILYAVWEKSGTRGNLTWKLSDDGVLTVGGEGEMASFETETVPWAVHMNDIKSIVIEDGFTSIGARAFCQCKNAESVTIPASVTRIDTEAFLECTSLSAVTFADCSTSLAIGTRAFAGCTALNAVSLPEGTVSIGEKAFEKCGKLSILLLPVSLTDISDSAFEQCDDEKRVFYSGTTDRWIENGLCIDGALVLCDSDNRAIVTGTCGDGLTWRLLSGRNDSLTISGTGAMPADSANAPWYEWIADDGYFVVENIYIDSTVSPVTAHVFDGCDPDVDVYFAGSRIQWNTFGLTVPDDCTVHFGTDSFSGKCGDDLTWTMTDDGVLNVSGTGAMYDYEDEHPDWYSFKDSITTVVIGDGVTRIGDFAFWECGILTDVTIADSVQELGDGAFSECDALESISIPSGVTVLDYTFWCCTSLKSIELPVSVTQIIDRAFDGCGSLADVYYAGSAADRAAMTIGSGNNKLTDAAWHYAYYKVSYNANGGDDTPDAQNVVPGESVTLEEIGARDGYLFLGWAADPAAVKADYAAGETVTPTGDMNLYAVWAVPHTLTSGRSYTAQIAEAGGTAYYEYTPTAGKTYVLYTTGSEAVTITLYNAAGKVLASGTNRLAYPMAADTAYYYAVRYAEETAADNIALKFGRVYTVKFNANGGTGAPAAQTKDYGSAMQLPETIPVKEGYAFVGWAGSTSAESAVYEAGAEYTANGNTTLYAVWAGLQPLKSGRSYTADIKAYSTGVYYSFTPANSNTYVMYANGGENVTITLYNEAGTVIETSGENAAVAAKLTAGETYVYRVSLNDGSAGSVSLKFGRVYTIRYNANGGTGAPAAQEKYYGRAVKVSETVPTRAGYTFLGWSASKNAEKATYQAGGDYTANGNTTLYAVWQIDQ